MATDSGTPLKLSDAALIELTTLDPAAPLDDLDPRYWSAFAWRRACRMSSGA